MENKVLNYEGRKRGIKTGKFDPKNYEYLDYCYDCGNKITFIDRLLFNVSHGIMGNCHKKCKQQ